jgi:DNA-directed RNA polymerase specialized sigma24 family protein
MELAGRGRAGRHGLGGSGFERLLALLDADRERAGERYEVIRRKLTKFFEWRGCLRPDELADETIDRVARRLADGELILADDPAGYFHGVAQNVLRETWARARREPEPLADAPEVPEDRAPGAGEALAERRLACLDRCLQRLAPESRRLVLAYYGEGHAIRNRRALAAELGIAPNALRIRMHRLRARLEACVQACLVARETEPSPGPRSDERGAA